MRRKRDEEKGVRETGVVGKNGEGYREEGSRNKSIGGRRACFQAPLKAWADAEGFQKGGYRPCIKRKNQVSRGGNFQKKQKYPHNKQRKKHLRLALKKRKGGVKVGEVFTT